MVAGARLFESMFDMSYSTALWISAIATISYVFIGGFLAVSWTDTIQATLMIFAPSYANRNHPDFFRYVASYARFGSRTSTGHELGR